MKHDFIALLLIAVFALHLTALRCNWRWYTNNYQARAMIKQWGENGFAAFSYLICGGGIAFGFACLLYTSPSPRDRTRSRMPSSA